HQRVERMGRGRGARAGRPLRPRIPRVDARRAARRAVALVGRGSAMIDRDELAWSEGNRGFALHGWNFATVHGGAPAGWVPGENCFVFYKTRALVDQYLHFFHGPARGARVANVLELGLWDGGSVPFWCEALAPQKYVGVDLRQPPGETPYFAEYLSRDG